MPVEQVVGWNRGVLRLRCVRCGEFLARDAAAVPESRPSRSDPDSCGACAGEVAVATSELAEAWAGLR